MPTISKDMTFAPDYGRQMQAQRRRGKPKANPYLRATGDTKLAQQRLEALQERFIIQQKAEMEWERLHPMRRALLSFFGFDAVSYAQKRGPFYHDTARA